MSFKSFIDIDADECGTYVHLKFVITIISKIK